MKKRVVVTGIGAISPIGNNVESMWNSIKNGVCGIDFIKAFDTENFKVKIAAEVKDFCPENYMEKKEVRRLDRFSQFAIAASEEAYKMASIDAGKVDMERMGVLIGSGIGGMSTIEKEYGNMLQKGAGRVSPFYIPMAIGNMAAGNVAIKYGAKGPCESIVTACATGTNAIGEGMRIIQCEDADIMIVGGSEASITPLSLAGFTNLSALSTSNNPLRASIPFDRERDGFVMGEGAGILILESLEHAEKRGAKILAELCGYGATCDAYHITSPCPDGSGAARAMKIAMDKSQILPEEVSYINAHGTSTPYNDKFETVAIKAAFKEKAYSIPISSTKSMTGHLLGAAGAVEAIICIETILNKFVSPTIGYKVFDEECDIDVVPNVGRNLDIEYAMSNSLGFGGHNASIIFKKWM